MAQHWLEKAALAVSRIDSSARCLTAQQRNIGKYSVMWIRVNATVPTNSPPIQVVRSEYDFLWEKPEAGHARHTPHSSLTLIANHNARAI